MKIADHQVHPPVCLEPQAPPSPTRWLDALRLELEAHPAVNHLLLSRLATGPYTRRDYLSFGLQHYALVGFFTRYMELLLLRAPSSDQKLWLAKVLVDEYGEGSDGEDHATLYRAFLARAGAEPGQERTTPLCREAFDFVREHLRICRDEPFLVGLGALGPGHEWSIPKMFSHVIPGLARAGFRPDERLYFDLHTEQDVDHGAWMSEVLERLVTRPEDQAQVRRGALLSLEARYRFWTGVEREVVAWRQPASRDYVARGLHQSGARPEAQSPGTLVDLEAEADAILGGRA